uniref:Uncharacterized protein n=2 Tax=Oryza sativa subsp. japonica TaxID=39947 RepID=Q7G5S2_ORYSJ|nr:hypothetical protein [Oryza sativa Japonica Group]AAO73238.1 hypothetical protein [Oryza sativa Japonica Group]ABF96991.1 hypothetical protein LOC_Os03g34020 [Oryza sativa Japonica Group]
MEARHRAADEGEIEGEGEDAHRGAAAKKARRRAVGRQPAKLGGGSWRCSGDGGAPEGADERQRRGNTDVRWVFGDEKWWPSYGGMQRCRVTLECAGVRRRWGSAWGAQERVRGAQENGDKGRGSSGDRLYGLEAAGSGPRGAATDIDVGGGDMAGIVVGVAAVQRQFLGLSGRGEWVEGWRGHGSTSVGG